MDIVTSLITGTSLRNCVSLAPRLVFRQADSTGYLEVCNDQLVWSLACADNNITHATIMVACSQLGFDRNFVQSFPARASTVPYVVDGRPFTSVLTSRDINCRGDESRLQNCQTPSRLKRIAEPDEEPQCSSVLYVQCGGESILKTF